MIETAHTTFARLYIWVNNEMHFKASITLRSTGENLENDIILYPLQAKTLKMLFRTAGFRDINWYGSFSGEPLVENSFVSIAHCLA